VIVVVEWGFGNGVVNIKFIVMEETVESASDGFGASGFSSTRWASEKQGDRENASMFSNGGTIVHGKVAKSLSISGGDTVETRTFMGEIVVGDMETFNEREKFVIFVL
jgi:hypothetical protein